ncbi:MAG: phosphatase PAP2 family protein [Defluviitaleaceae bacterium]|nr:phosphatase PAP2 family protein [Defluviitaleaceae bacterium]MCL2836592.1 phosphatase PAP2 family protein [Defluviitaleaceae bacterium]
MDKRIFMAFYGYAARNKRFGGIMGFIYKCSTAAFFLIYYSGALYLIFTDTPALVSYVCVPACVLAANWVIRRLVKRNRPFQVLPLVKPPENKKTGKTGDSFPSNHSASASIIAFSFLMINTFLGTAAFFLAVLTGLSRITSGAHYPSDVIAGFALSAAFAILGYSFIPFIFA